MNLIERELLNFLILFFTTVMFLNFFKIFNELSVEQSSKTNILYFYNLGLSKN